MTELVILGPSPVTVVRDAWDWLLYALSLVAALTAIVAFSVWASELRRRPEIRFYWRLSPDGDPANLTVWAPDHVPEVSSAGPFLVEAAVQNTGDKAGSDTLINFVAPDCFDLHEPAYPQAEFLTATNEIAGLPPDYRVVFAAPRAEPWTPGNWFMRHYQLQLRAAQECDGPVQVRLLFDVSDSRFNSRGRRWLPSVVPALELRGAPAGTPTPWPPAPMRRRRIRWTRPEPHGRVVCSPGDRMDVRDLIVMPAEEAPHARRKRAPA